MRTQASQVRHIRIAAAPARTSLASDPFVAVLAKRYEAYHLGMSRIRPEYLDPETSDRSVAADVLVREEPDEEEDEEEDEGDGKEDDDDDDKDDGYSE